MHYNLTFYFLISIIFLPPILSTNPSKQVLLEKMDKFHDKFKGEIDKFKEKFDEIFGNLEELKNEQFGNAMFKKEFPSEVINAKDELEKYLKGKITFQLFFDAMNSLKLKGEALKTLKALKHDYKLWIAVFGGGKAAEHSHNPFLLKNLMDLKGNSLTPLMTQTDQIKPQLELLEILVEMHESVNAFVEEIIEMMKKNLLKKMDEFHEEFKGKFKNFGKKFSEIFSKEKLMSKKFADAMFKKEFPEEILEAKEKMKEYLQRKGKFEVTLNALNKLKLEEKKLEALKLLKVEWKNKKLRNPNTNKALIISDFEKFAKEKEASKSDPHHKIDALSKQLELYNSLVELREFTNKFLEDFVKNLRLVHIKRLLKTLIHHINGQNIEFDQKNAHSDTNPLPEKEFASLAESDDLQSLNIACNQMLIRIKPVINKKAIGIEQSCKLADIYWLAEFIQEKLTKVDGVTYGPIYNLAKAMETEELPGELELKNVEIELKEKAILIAKNMLFIAAQLGKVYNFEDAIFETYMEYPIVSSKYERIEKMIKKELAMQNIGQFYQKCEEIVVKKGEQKFDTEMLTKSEQNSAGSS